MSNIIYKITNKINNKSYIGQTIRPLDERWKEHCSGAKHNHFHNTIKKYGKESFELKVVEEVEDVNYLNEREVYWIKYFDTFHKGYNSTTGGKQSTGFSKEVIDKRVQTRKGYEHTEETKNKMSRSMSGDRNPMFGKTGNKHHLYKGPKEKNLIKSPHTEATIIKMKNKFWINNGSINKKLNCELDIPEGWRKGRLISWEFKHQSSNIESRV